MLIWATRDTKFKKLCFNGHPRYTSTNVHIHTLFLYFSDFSIFFIWKKKNKNWKINKQSMLNKNKAMHKTRLTQNNKAKHTSNAHIKIRRGEREEVMESLRALFLPHLWRTFLFSKPLIQWWGGRVKTIQVWKEHEGFEKISKRSKRGWKLILVSHSDHDVALLSG